MYVPPYLTLQSLHFALTVYVPVSYVSHTKCLVFLMETNYVACGL
jgi:hypothetical protein